MELDISDILQVLSRFRKPKTGREIAVIMGVSPRQKQEVYRLLHELVRKGDVKKMRGGKFVLLQQKRRLQGRLQLLRNGSGVVALDGQQQEVRVPERALFGAMNGDLVEVVIALRSRGGRPEGEVVRVVEREVKEIIGLYHDQKGQGVVIPVDTGGSAPFIRVIGERPPGLEPDQIVVVHLEDPSAKSNGLSGHIIEILGDASDPAVEMLVIARRFGIPTTFPDNVSRSAQQVTQRVTPEECHGRRDLRHMPFVTIDGETARDFDDAVTLSQDSSGEYRLLVAIADVAHYVPANSPLDQEALLRGTSVYLPGTCLPMLPEDLSNGICSLNPAVDRLVLVAELLFDQNAMMIHAAFSEAVISSQARLTYTGVQAFLEQSSSSTSPEPFMNQLLLMQELASRLTIQRLKRGALDLDIPEAEIILDTNGKPDSIARLQRTMAHRLIEEFMLAANEAVASALTASDFPVIYRIHEPPAEQDLEPFFKAAKRMGAAIDFHQETLLARLQHVLTSLDGKTEAGILNRLLLRSLKQAAYHTENKGHFGLASNSYCHFTSPIRRYPDLVVHRMLKQKLAGAVGETLSLQLKKRFQVIAEQNSKAERRAIDAERDASAMKTCQFMIQHIGETHDGCVTSVHAFGFFVELETIFVEGLVHVASLGDDYYRFDHETSRLVGEGSNVVYEVGTPVTIVVRDVNVQRREIDFTVLQKQARARRPSIKMMRKRNR